MTVLERAEDEALWWAAAALDDVHFRPQAEQARRRLACLRRAALTAPAGSEIPQATIDLILERITMPDVIPDIVAHLCGEALEWRPNSEEARFPVCPFCGHPGGKCEVNLRSGKWHCWACNEGGSLKWLLMRQSGLGFRALMRELGHYAGVSIEQESATPPGVMLL